MNYKELLEKIKAEGNYKVFSGGFGAAQKTRYTGCGLRENNTSSPQIFWMKNGRFHRLDGPALIDAIHGVEYSIDHCVLGEKEYWEHPLVLNHKLKTILEL